MLFTMKHKNRFLTFNEELKFLIKPIFKLNRSYELATPCRVKLSFLHESEKDKSPLQVFSYINTSPTQFIMIIFQYFLIFSQCT